MRGTAVGLAILSALPAAAWPDRDAHGQPNGETELSGKRTLIAQSRFTVTNARAQSELIQLVVDFEPGAWTSLHTHGGQAINLVLDGEITLRHGGTDRSHKAGQSWTDSTSQVHAAGNTGSGKARLLTNFLLSKDAPQITVVQESQFGPAVTYEAKFALPALPPEAEIVQQVVDLSSGARARRAYIGFAASIVVGGEVTYKIGPEQKAYKPGEAWSAPAGTLIAEENGSPSTARVFTTYLVPRGASP